MKEKFPYLAYNAYYNEYVLVVGSNINNDKVLYVCSPHSSKYYYINRGWIQQYEN